MSNHFVLELSCMPGGCRKGDYYVFDDLQPIKRELKYDLLYSHGIYIATWYGESIILHVANPSGDRLVSIDLHPYITIKIDHLPKIIFVKEDSQYGDSYEMAFLDQEDKPLGSIKEYYQTWYPFVKSKVSWLPEYKPKMDNDQIENIKPALSKLLSAIRPVKLLKDKTGNFSALYKLTPSITGKWPEENDPECLLIIEKTSAPEETVDYIPQVPQVLKCLADYPTLSETGDHIQSSSNLSPKKKKFYRSQEIKIEVTIDWDSIEKKLTKEVGDQLPVSPDPNKPKDESYEIAFKFSDYSECATMLTMGYNEMA